MEKLELSFTSTLKANYSDIGADILEIGIDKLLKDGILKDLPIVNSFIQTAKFGMAIRDRELLKKILIFLNETKSISTNEKIEFLEKYYEGKEEKFGERLLIILDRIDEIDKTKVIANLYKNTLLEKISKEDFYRLSGIIEKAFLEDLLELSNKEKNNEIKDFYTGHNDKSFILSNLGLFNVKSGFGSLVFELNNFGKKIIKHGLNINC